MSSLSSCLARLCLAAALLFSPRVIPQTVDPQYSVNLENEGRVQRLLLQRDGKLLITGDFIEVGGVPRQALARLLPDGSADTSFVSSVTANSASAIALTTNDYVLVSTGTNLVRLLPNGDLDLSFNRISFGLGGLVSQIAVLSDDRFYVVGTFSQAATSTNSPPIVRFLPDGQLDSSFRPTNFIQGGQTRGVLIQAIVPLPDGSTIVGGNFDTVGGIRLNRLARLNSNGSVDPNFSSPLTGSSSTFSGLALEADGNILAAGNLQFNPPFPGMPRRLLRFDQRGRRDENFFSKVQNLASSALSLALDAQGRILLGSGMFIVNGQQQDSVIRVNKDGSRDSTFNSTLDGELSANALAVGPDGRIFFGGTFNGIGRRIPMTLAALQPNGQFDPTLEARFTSANRSITDVLLQSDGKAVVAGNFTAIDGQYRHRIARLQANGQLDTTFDPGSGFSGEVRDIDLQGDTVLAMGGFFYFNGRLVNHLIRLNAHGSHDPSFAGTLSSGAIGQILRRQNNQILIGGWFTTINDQPVSELAQINEFGQLDPAFTAAAIDPFWVHALGEQSDGKIVIGGSFETVGGVSRKRVARLNPDGKLDLTFDPGQGCSYGNVESIALQFGDRILIGGSFSYYNNLPANGLARLLPDGQLDRSFNEPLAFVSSIEKILVLKNNWILLSGTLSPAAGGSAQRIMLLRPDGSVDASFTFPGGIDNLVYDLALEPSGQLLIAGSFQSINDLPRPGIARISLPLMLSDDYQQWREAHSIPVSAPDDTDADGDGLSILAEYAFNLDPGQSSSFSSISHVARAGDQLQWSFPEPRSGVLWDIHSSADLKTWRPAEFTRQPVAPGVALLFNARETAAFFRLRLRRF